MTFKIHDAWTNKVVARHLSYREAKDYITKNEPPLNPRVGARYTFWPE
jgi:hypothetical protein